MTFNFLLWFQFNIFGYKLVGFDNKKIYFEIKTQKALIPDTKINAFEQAFTLLKKNIIGIMIIMQFYIPIEEITTELEIIKEHPPCSVYTMSFGCFNQINNYLKQFPNIKGKTIQETKNNIMETKQFKSGCFTYLQAQSLAEYFHKE